MDNEFTPAEIEEAIMAARIFSPDYGQEQFEAAGELERRLGDSSYLGAVCSLARFEKEKGVACTEVLDTCERLLRDSAKLERKVADSRATLETIEGKVTQAQDKLHQLEEATEQAKAEREREEKGLAAFRKKAEKEKQAIERELEKCRQEANVAKEETVAAGRLKSQLAARGFTIEFTLDLCQEFVGRESAKEELAEAIEKHGALTKSNAALIEQGKAQKETLESELNELKSEKDRREAEIKNFEQARHQLENILGQLQADVAHEEELRRFYYRYYGREGLLECLASWDQIFFMRCNSAVHAIAGIFDRSAGNARFWTDKPPAKCPHCGMTMLLPDEKPYQALNWPVGAPIKLQLGE